MTNTIVGHKVVEIFERWAPKQLAYDWDNVGLQVGSLNKPVNKIMVTLDVLENVVDEAIDKQVNFIIAHHPLLFKPLKEIDLDTPAGKIIEKLIKHDITVYAAHTNLDIASGGVNDILANLLGIENNNVLIETELEKLIKLSVYVPETHAQELANALGNAGAGHIGNYSHCMFNTAGEGSFKPLSGTNPFIGERGRLEKVKEVKIETIIKDSQKTTILQAISEAHPYEEPAYDLFPLENQGEVIGVGRIGTLPKPKTLKEFSEHVKVALDVPSLRVIGDLNRKVQKVAVLGGSGKGFIHQAKLKGADVYVTGDMTFHDAQDAWQMGLSVIDPGHHVEKVMKEAVKDYLNEKMAEQNVEVIVSKENTEPFQFL